MRSLIEHRSLYRYSVPIRPARHLLRLHPRSDAQALLRHYRLQVWPVPVAVEQLYDSHGNTVHQVDFVGETTALDFQAYFEVEVPELRPPDSWVYPVALGTLYPHGQWSTVAPYLRGENDPAAAALASEFAASSGGDVGRFLQLLNEWIHAHVEHEIRHAGDPLSPAATLATRRGACRDVAVLFIAACRSHGLAARFVSGYQVGIIERSQRFMHAWPEVAIPGLGWRGYDPTHGTPVSPAHLAVAAAPEPAGANPIEGGFFGSADSTLDVELTIGPPPAGT